MSASLHAQSGNALPATFQASQEDVHSDIGDGSSSLSDIEDKEADQEDLDDLESNDDNNGGRNIPGNDADMDSDTNDSEAETERLENSPHKLRSPKDVTLNSQTDSRIYERSPSKLKHAFAADEDEDDVDDLSDAVTIEGSTKSFTHLKDDQDSRTAATSLGYSPGERQPSVNISDKINKKRKRSQLTDRASIGAEEIEEHARKRTGSVVGHNDEYAIDEATSANGDVETSNPISGDISDVDSEDGHNQRISKRPASGHDNVESEDGDAEARVSMDISRVDVEEAVQSKDAAKDNSKELSEPGEEPGEDERVSNSHEPDIGEAEEPDDPADVEADEAEAAVKNEEEQEKRRRALEQLSDIERHFFSFRDRLHEERLAQLDREEAMLKSDIPTHPMYLEMMRTIDARRDQKLRKEARLTEYRLESIQREAVGKRSQILTQFYQEVRETREKKLEELGKQWYDIQHDRRGYGSHVEDFAIKFPTKRSRQVMHHNAFTKEVSLLAGISKYVGFPAAPVMSAATPNEIEQDLDRMGRLQQKQHVQRTQQALPLQDFAALRAAASASSFKPAEEQFIEQTPWANPQHPSHAHLLQRQTSAHQAARTSSPFSMQDVTKPRRHSHQNASGTPISGTFSGTNAAVGLSNGNAVYTSGGRTSPLTSFPIAASSQKVAPSSSETPRTSVSPQQNRQPAANKEQARHDDQGNGALDADGVFASRPEPNRIQDHQLHYPFENGVPVKREQVAAVGRF